MPTQNASDVLSEVRGQVGFITLNWTTSLPKNYPLNHLIHTYPERYLALMDGIVMGGGYSPSCGPGRIGEWLAQ